MIRFAQGLGSIGLNILATSNLRYYRNREYEGDSNKMAYIFAVIGVILVLGVAWVWVGCIRVPSKYVIDIDKLMDAEPETCDQQLTKIAGCRLSHTDYRQEGIDDAKGTTSDIATMTYEKVDGIVNESGSYPRIVIRFNAEQHSENLSVYFGEYVDKMKALRRVGFEEQDLLGPAAPGPYRWDAYTQKGTYLIYEREEFSGRFFIVPNFPGKTLYWVSWEQFDDGRTTGLTYSQT